MFILPIFQCYNFCNCIGIEIKDMSIAVRNDEIDYSNCKYSNFDSCIFDNENNQTLSCVFMDYFISENYKLVSLMITVEPRFALENYIFYLHLITLF